jgi:hypothetical protein
MDFSRNAPMSELQVSDLDERVRLLATVENHLEGAHQLGSGRVSVGVL